MLWPMKWASLATYALDSSSNQIFVSVWFYFVPFRPTPATFGLKFYACTHYAHTHRSIIARIRIYIRSIIVAFNLYYTFYHAIEWTYVRTVRFLLLSTACGSQHRPHVSKGSLFLLVSFIYWFKAFDSNLIKFIPFHSHTHPVFSQLFSPFSIAYTLTGKKNNNSNNNGW